jgi:hypothetical protein
MKRSPVVGERTLARITSAANAPAARRGHAERHQAVLELQVAGKTLNAVTGIRLDASVVALPIGKGRRGTPLQRGRLTSGKEIGVTTRKSR